MGSLKTDGTRIVQTREATRNIGRAYTFSADGVQTEVLVDEPGVSLGTEPDSGVSQRSIWNQGRSVVINDEDGVLLERATSAAATGNPIDQDVPWVGAGGAITWPLTIPNDLGAVPQIVGPTDQQFELNAGSGQAFRIEAGDKDGLAGWTFGGPLRMYAGYGTNGAHGGILDFAAGNGAHGGDAFFYAGEGTTTPGSTFIDGGPGVTEDGTVFIGTYSGYTSQVVLGNTFSPVTASGVVKQLKPYLEVISLTNLQERTLAASSGSVITVLGTGTRTIKLPASPAKSLKFDIKDGDGTASSGNIAIHGNGKNIDGQASGVLDTNYESRTVIYNGTQWNNI
jgi:hypothetical protein